MKKLFKFITYPIWKPIHWLFIEEVFYIKEERYLNENSKNVIRSLFTPFVKKRVMDTAEPTINEYGNKVFEVFNFPKFASKEEAEIAINLYKLKKEKEKTVIHKVVV